MLHTATNIQLGYREFERETRDISLSSKPFCSISIARVRSSSFFQSITIEIMFDKTARSRQYQYYTIMTRMRFASLRVSINKLIDLIPSFASDIWSRSSFSRKFFLFSDLIFFNTAFASERLIFPKNENQRTCEKKRSAESMQATIVSTLKGSEREIHAAVEAPSTV